MTETLSKSSTLAPLSQETLIIKPIKGWASLNLSDLWRYRELIYFLIWRDIKVRYKQTILGASWAILNPFFTMIVFTIFFGRLAKVSTGDIPYPIFSFTGLLPWGLFTKALSDAGRSMISNRSMITKIYFPRLVIPIASVLSGLVDFALSFVVLIGMMIYYNVLPGSTYHVSLSPAILTLPLFLLLSIVTALGIGLWLSALNVIYRDVNYIIPFLTQFWLFVTPIAYPITLVSEKWRILFWLNPMTGVVSGFRWATLGNEAAPDPLIWVSVLISLVVLASGLVYFRRMERTFADTI
jgi:lipopolysaccharide transport system permease protein